MHARRLFRFAVLLSFVTFTPALRAQEIQAAPSDTTTRTDSVRVAPSGARIDGMRAGVQTFRRFVESWYAGGFQKIIFHPTQQPDVRRMICSILAGYAWDTKNPYVADSGRRLAVLEELCDA